MPKASTRQNSKTNAGSSISKVEGSLNSSPAASSNRSSGRGAIADSTDEERESHTSSPVQSSTTSNNNNTNHSTVVGTGSLFPSASLQLPLAFPSSSVMQQHEQTGQTSQNSDASIIFYCLNPNPCILSTVLT